MGWHYLSVQKKHQGLHCWSSRMHEWFHPKLNTGGDCLFMLGLNFVNGSPGCQWIHIRCEKDEIFATTPNNANPMHNEPPHMKHSVGCNYFCMPEIPISVTKIYIYAEHDSLQSNLVILISSMISYIREETYISFTIFNENLLVHWNRNVILTKFSSRAAPKVVKMTTFGAVSD